MNYIDLFSGIGGFALGAHWAGMKFENHYFSEVEPYAVELYQQRFPDAIPLGDIREIDCEKLADTTSKQSRGIQQPELSPDIGAGGQGWIITGGFPCQDISVAGKGEGIGGSRSGLWFEMWRIIRELRPRFVIAENVGALTFRGMDAVLSSLAEIGYDAEWQDIRAEDMGAPHRRERIWIVAYPERDGRNPRRAKCAGQQGRITLDGTGGEMADTKETIRRRTNGTDDAGRGNPQAGGCSISGCGLSHWTIEPNVGRLAHGVPSRVDRLKGLGNAIVPQIAEMLFRQIKELI